MKKKYLRVDVEKFTERVSMVLLIIALLVGIVKYLQACNVYTHRALEMVQSYQEVENYE